MTNFKALSQANPPHDYQAAVQGALSWLGKRYLLAEPMNRQTERSATAQPKRPEFTPIIVPGY